MTKDEIKQCTLLVIFDCDHRAEYSAFALVPPDFVGDAQEAANEAVRAARKLNPNDDDDLLVAELEKRGFIVLGLKQMVFSDETWW